MTTANQHAHHMTTKPRITTPKDAATVILLRERETSPFEIFLMRRHRQQRFMGGAFVFPGGALDPEDCDEELIRHITGIAPENAAARLNEPEKPRLIAMGLYIAAVRETFEEAGVLLANLDETANRMFTERSSGFREKIHDHVLTLKEFAVQENISFALDLLVPYARWITPEAESIRFDTRFFLAKKPRLQNAEHDRIELVDSLWITPETALKKNTAREILLMPPTLKTIEELAAFSSVTDLFAFAANREIQPILPQAFHSETGFGVLLPHDPEYTIDAYKQPPRASDPSRVVLVDGRFKTMCAP